MRTFRDKGSKVSKAYISYLLDYKTRYKLIRKYQNKKGKMVSATLPERVN